MWNLISKLKNRDRLIDSEQADSSRGRIWVGGEIEKKKNTKKDSMEVETMKYVLIATISLVYLCCI